MTFKECRKEGRDEIIKSNREYGYIYLDRDVGYWFSFVYYDTSPPVFVLEKNGVVDKVVDGLWTWDFQRRGMFPKNEKGWNKKLRAGGVR